MLQSYKDYYQQLKTYDTVFGALIMGGFILANIVLLLDKSALVGVFAPSYPIFLYQCVAIGLGVVTASIIFIGLFVLVPPLHKLVTLVRG